MPAVSPENLTSTVDFLVWLNTITDQRFGPALIIMFGIVVFLTLKVYNTERAFSATAFVIGILGVLLSGVGLLSTTWMVACVSLALIGVLLVIWDNG